MVMKLNKMVLDKKIDEAANLHRFELIASMHGSTLGTPMQCFEEEVDAETDLIENSFIAGAEWAINEFQKSLCHPASEVPQIGRGRVLAYSIDCCCRNLYNLYDMMSKTDCNIYQEMWNEQVKAYHLTGWIYADELFDLIIEGGNHD